MKNGMCHKSIVIDSSDKEFFEYIENFIEINFTFCGGVGPMGGDITFMFVFPESDNDQKIAFQALEDLVKVNKEITEEAQNAIIKQAKVILKNA